MFLHRGAPRLLTSSIRASHSGSPNSIFSHALSQPLRPSTGWPQGVPIPHFTSRHGARQFHLPAAAEATIQFAQDSMLAFHANSGLPWFLAIPGFALAVHLIFRLPSDVYVRHLLRKEVSLTKFMDAWGAYHRQVVQEPGRAMHQATRTQQRLVREHGCQHWKRVVATLSSFPPWLMMFEAVRQLMGGGHGLLSMMMGTYPSAQAPSPRTSSSTEVAGGQTEYQWNSSTGLLEPKPDPAPAPAIDPPELPLSDSLAIQQASADTGLSTGGILWFTDLTAPDPYGILPAILAVSFCAVLLPRNLEGLREFFNLSMSAISSDSTRSTRLRRAGFIIYLTMPFLMMNLPAGLHVYLISSSIFGTAGRRFVWNRMPLPPDLHPCVETRKVFLDSPPRHVPKPPPSTARSSREARRKRLE